MKDYRKKNLFLTREDICSIGGVQLDTKMTDVNLSKVQSII